MAAGFIISLVVFFWALNSGQFKDQQRARFLPLQNDLQAKPAKVPRFARIQTYALLTLVGEKAQFKLCLRKPVMRYFQLLGIQHFVMYLFPTLATIVLFIIGLGFYYFRRRDSEVRKKRIIEEFPGGIQGRNAPFPLIIYLTIIGTIIWALAYILLIGGLGVKI
jgi:cbb3-type cytochrome oxidase maturation protein